MLKNSLGEKLTAIKFHFFTPVNKHNAVYLNQRERKKQEEKLYRGFLVRECRKKKLRRAKKIKHLKVLKSEDRKFPSF